MSKTPANLTRNQLAEFLPNQRLIRAFEQLLEHVNTSIPTDLDSVFTEAANASASARINAQLTSQIEEASLAASNANAGVNMCIALINAIANDSGLTASSILDIVRPLIPSVTLQNAYNNSSDPEIVTDATRRALSVKIGTGSNSDNVFEGVNIAGSPTFSVNGFGDIVMRNINGIALTGVGDGLSILANDGNYYLYTDLASPLQNCYNNSIPPEILTAPGIDAVTFRRGTFSDSDNVIAVQNNASTVNFAVTGNGTITGGGSAGINVASDGRLYGSALHNTGTVTGTTNQYIASGTYTPTLTNVTNVAASTARLCQWIRVGNVVTVSGQLDIDLTTTLLASEIGMSLPIASALTTAYQLGGTANAVAFQANWAIQADAANDRAQFKSTGIIDVGNDAYTFHFMYTVL
jgi:hypothetical protein